MTLTASETDGMLTGIQEGESGFMHALRFIFVCAGVMGWGAGELVAQERRQAPLEGRGAAIAFYGAGEVDTLKPGAVLFNDRKYTLNECPSWLQGKRFLRGSMESSSLRVTGDGVLTLMTPEPDLPRAATQVKTLEARGFVWVANPEHVQLFGKQPFDLTRIYQKQVKKGERLRLGKWAVAAGFEEASPLVATNAPWSENRGERLYNGIVLPAEWPPQNIDSRDTAPMAVPYLASRPNVVPIDVGRQLFVDDFLIETGTLTRVFHMPQKYTGNPVLKPETELERNPGKNAAAVPKSGGVWWDPAEKIFKMWYEAGWIHTICYATSKDGLTWERPSLDVKPGTNQVLPPDLTPDSWTVVPDWEAKDPLQRYKMFMRPPGGQIPGVSMTSADGIHWTNRVVTGSTGDRSTMFYNPFRKKWVYSLRSGFRGRSRHYWECDDFLAGAKWNPDDPVVWAAVDRDDPQDPVIQRVPQLYNLDAVAYESIMLGVYEIHHGPENDVCDKMGVPKITELNFSYSRDGFHWSRPDRRAQIPAERRDVWDRGYVQSLGNLCCVRGDTLWFYYSGFQGDTNKVSKHWLATGMYDRGATGLAFLRRDGFASLEAGDQPGTLTTRPVTFTGAQVFVNAETSQGELKVEILDASGAVIAPFTLANCRPVRADSTLSAVTWEGAGDVAALRGKPVRFRFTLRSGALYAFWVSRDATGRSDGFVAGGGPGFTGKSDTVGRAALQAEKVSLSAVTRSLLPSGWDVTASSDKVLKGLFNVCAPQVKGAHDASFVIVDGKAYIVYIANDKQPGENPEWDFLYVALSVVDVKSGTVDKVIPFASAEKAFENMTLPRGAAFVPRVISKDSRTLRCFFNSENPGAYEAQTWVIDYDIGRGDFDKRIYKARLKTSQGIFDMQPAPFYRDAVAHGFTGKPRDYGLYPFDIKTFDGRFYVGLNNYPVGQNALALLGEDLLTFEVLGHYNEPSSMKLTESAVNRLPDGTWLAICRQEGGSRNYAFTQSKDGKTWTPGEYRNVVRCGTSSKPTFDRFGGVYYLGWQEATGTGTVNRSVFNIEVSRDGVNWERKYRFVTDKSFQYPAFRKYEDVIYLTVTQGDFSDSRKERIMFGKLE
jgi:hypothetical protein